MPSLKIRRSVRANGKYQFKYVVNGKAKFLYSWRLTPSDPQPAGKLPCLSLRELEKSINRDLESRLDPSCRNLTVNELVERYLKTRTGVRESTRIGYNFVRNLLKNEEFGDRKMCEVKTSDAKLFLIKLQSDGRGSSTIKTVRGVLRPAFQMAVDDDLLMKNPFGFELVGVIYNTEKTRLAITREQMNKFLKFIHDDNIYCKYYEAIYILFHTGMRISEFCGLTLKDIDLENRIIDINHQVQRFRSGKYDICPTKTSAGTRKLPMTEEVYQMFKYLVENRPTDLPEVIVKGYAGFLIRDKDGMPEVALHWEHRFQHAVKRYNDIYKIQMPSITPHVCRHSEISVTMGVYTHLGLDDDKDEIIRLKELEDARKEINNIERDTMRSMESQFKYN